MKKRIKDNGIGILCVLAAAVFAILVHALLPSPGATLDVTEFDGFLVQKLGFPVVASVYFIILYLHIWLLIKYYGAKSEVSNKEIGIRYGVAFGVLYLVGMQEVVVSSSPFDTYGADFVAFQFFMGLGDAIPVMALCLVVSIFTLRQRRERKERLDYRCKNCIVTVCVIAILFFVQRTIGYYVDYLDSDIQQYPIPVLVWTAVTGVAFGIIYLILRPIYEGIKHRKKTIQIVVVSLGLNWIWFNCFMGLILKGLFVKMCIRGGIDVVVVMVGCLLSGYIVKHNHK